jgi:hypothetical protein
VLNLQEKMFAEVEAWVAAEGLKTEFSEGKAYSEAKFNFWLSKWKANQMTSDDGFRGLAANGWKEVKLSKVLGICFAATAW